MTKRPSLKTAAGVQWHRDNMGDYVIEIDRTKEGLPMVRGRIVRCPIVKRFKHYHWRTTPRWLLLVNDHQYGFWNKLSEAISRFDKDCVPKKKPVETLVYDDLDDLDPEYYCWHGDKPFGPGPYCTSCGGLIKKDKK